MKKIKLILITTMSVCLLSGCSHENPLITERGKTDWTDDDITIDVTNAKTGLKGYEIIEEDNEVKVILRYDKR